MIVDEQDLAQIRAQNTGKVIMLAGGGFDLLHRGHLDYLEAARKCGDMLVVALASDKELQDRKGPERPVVCQSQRVRLVAALKPVDYALVRQGEPELVASMNVIIELLKPDIVFLYQDIPPHKLRALQKTNPHTQFLIDTQSKVEATTAIIERTQYKYKITEEG